MDRMGGIDRVSVIEKVYIIADRIGERGVGVPSIKDEAVDGRVEISLMIYASFTYTRASYKATVDLCVACVNAKANFGRANKQTQPGRPKGM